MDWGGRYESQLQTLCVSPRGLRAALPQPGPAVTVTTAQRAPPYLACAALVSQCFWAHSSAPRGLFPLSLCLQRDKDQTWPLTLKAQSQGQQGTQGQGPQVPP